MIEVSICHVTTILMLVTVNSVGVGGDPVSDAWVTLSLKHKTLICSYIAVHGKTEFHHASHPLTDLDYSLKYSCRGKCR